MTMQDQGMIVWPASWSDDEIMWVKRQIIAEYRRSILEFGQLAEQNLSRVSRWHTKGGLHEWTVERWSNAMAGEVGEACNAVKKLNRIEDELENVSDHQIDTIEQAHDKIVEEIADTVIYGDLLCQRLGRTLAEAIRAKFNVVSERYGFPERL